MKRGIRARRLGSNYMKEALYDVFEANSKRKRLIKQREERISAGRSSEITEANRARNVQATNIQFTEPSSTERERPTREIISRRVGRSIASDIRQGLTRSDQRSQKTINTASLNLQKSLETTNKNINDLMKLLDSSLIIDENSTQSNKSNENSNNNSAISLFSLVSDLTKSLQDQQDTNQKILDALKNNQL